jgi:hypothetical protein
VRRALARTQRLEVIVAGAHQARALVGTRRLDRIIA